MQATARYNIYNRIHKGLRACFAQAQVNLGRLDWTDSDDVAAVMDEVRDLLVFCRKHLEKENAFVHTAMESRRPGSTAAAIGDHAHHEQDIDALTAQAFTIRLLPELRREEAVRALYGNLNRFVAENLAHMAMEECEHNRVLWDTHSDEEIMAIEHAIVASQSPEDARMSLRWMLPAMGAVERAHFLGEMRASAPAEVFDGVLGMLRPLLAEKDLRKLDTALNLARRPADYVGVL